jgi:hypothetical protein
MKMRVDPIALKRHVPTFFGFVERRQAARRNRLPKHLRPIVLWPLYLQIVLNTTLIITLSTLMLNKDEYLTDAGPAIVMAICLVMLFYTVSSAFKLKVRYAQIRGRRLSRLNFWLMALAFLCWPLAVVVFLP